MTILVCNAGSTSLKFKLYSMPESMALVEAKIERVGSANDAVYQYRNNISQKTDIRQNLSIPDYRTGIEFFLESLLSFEFGALKDLKEIDRVGFKTVLSKGYYGVHELTPPVIKGMEDWMQIAPAHNKPYLEAIRTLREFLGDAVFIGVFETAFHQTIPFEKRIYGVPYDWYERYGIQRMGYHGASHSYVADVLGEMEKEYSAISCHLGGSCSLCAIKDGRSVNTSFGMSLQTGIIHANRSGDFDCDLTMFLRNIGVSDDEISEGLSKKGGLLGLSGISNDLRYIEKAAEEGDARAKLAIDVFVYDIIRYIGSFYADMGGLNYLVFTGGIGENSMLIRKLVCSRLTHIGVALSESRNAGGHGLRVVSTELSRVKVLVIPANEELGVARRTYEYRKP